MEDSEPICETEQAPFCVEILKRLNIQRGGGYLCDITLMAKESKSKSKYHYVGKIVERHHANSKKLKNKTILKYTKITIKVKILIKLY